ncbi:MAG TPA: energy-coupling factor transporter transmembrane component T [Candidatus Limnocylindrales bacterium]|nr:energy-coupling factor transporter transmembrane component T [Candidatus Limnocylindrales bacterium]
MASRRPEPIDPATTGFGDAAALSAADAAFVAGLAPPAPSAYHRLNPMTKAVAATVESLGAFVIGGYLGPLAIIGLAVLPAAVIAGVAGRLVRISLLLTLPIAISVVLVSVFTRAGTTVLFTVGPFDATLEGVDFAGQTLVRLLAISTAIGLFGLTTESRSFVLDLERRGLSPRFAFVALATLEAVPAMVERASVIASAQRARGLDTEGSVRARLRGVLPLVGPVILSSLTEVEERSLALEVRAFGRPGRRALLWRIADSGAQFAARALMLVALLAAIAMRLTGTFPRLP